MGVEMGIMYMTYLLNFIIAFQLRWIAQDDPEPERRESQMQVFSMDLSSPVAGTGMSWREILETGQVGWKAKIKRKIVGMEMNTLDVTEETGNGEEKREWNEEIKIC